MEKIKDKLPDLASELLDSLMDQVEKAPKWVKLVNPVLGTGIQILVETVLELLDTSQDPNIQTQLQDCTQAAINDMIANAPTLRQQHDAEALKQENLTFSTLPAGLACISQPVEQAVARLEMTGDMELTIIDKEAFLKSFRDAFRVQVPKYQILVNHFSLMYYDVIHEDINEIKNQVREINQTVQVQVNQEQERLFRALKDRLEAAFQAEKQNSPRFEDKEVSETLLPLLLEEARVNNETKFSDFWKQHQTAPVQRHISLTGIGGIGKTTALLHSKCDRSVVYIPLRNLGRGNQQNNALLEQYIRRHTINKSALYDAFLELCQMPWSNGPQVTLMLDGFNELDAHSRPIVLDELFHRWLKMPGIQVVITSRYDIRTESGDTGPFYSFDHAQIQPLQRNTILKYLSETPGLEHTPKKLDQIWKLLQTPLILTLYTKSTAFRARNAHSVDYWREDLNNGSIIWNYLITEWLKLPFEERGPGFLAIFLVAPRICWTMEKSGTFSMSTDSLRNLLRQTINELRPCLEAELLPEYILSGCEQIAGDPKDWLKYDVLRQLLVQRFSLFTKHGRSLKITHQHFRDCLAAIHIINTAYMSDSIPTEWTLDFSPPVMEFVSDLLQSENQEPENTWEIIWNKKDAHSPPAFLKKMLTLYRNAYGPDITRVDFNNLDLSQVSLAGLHLSKNSLGHFRGTKLARDTFFGSGHGDTVSAVSWCPDGKHYLSASYDCTLRLYAVDGAVRLPQIHAREHHGYYIRCAGFDPSRHDRFASAGDDQTVVVWTLKDGKWNGKEWGRCGNWVRKLDWTADGSKLVCGDGDGSIFLFQGPGLQTPLEKLGGTVTALCWSADASRFAAADEKGLLHLYSSDGSTLSKQQLDGKTVSLAWLCADQLLLAATEQQLYLLSSENLNIRFNELFLNSHSQTEIQKNRIGCVCSIDVNDHTAQTAIFTSGGLMLRRILLSDDQLEVMDQAVWESKNNATQISSAQWHPNKDKLICGGQDGSVMQITVDLTEADRDRIQIQVIGQRCCRAARCSAWSPDHQTLATGWDDNRVRLWDLAANRCIRVLIGHTESVKCLAWSPSGQYLASSSDDATIRIWKHDGSDCNILAHHKGPVNTLLWLSETVLVSAGDDALVCVTNLRDKTRRDLQGHTKKIYALACSEDGKQLLSCGNDCTAILWDTGSWNHGTPQRVHDKPVRAAAWRKDLVMTSSNDTTAKLWQVEGGKLVPLRTLTGLNDFVYGANLSPDGQYVIGACTDSKVAFWNITQPNPVCISCIHDNFAWHVSVAPDRAATASSDGTVRIWDLSDGAVRADMTPIQTLEAIPESNLVDCDLRGAQIDRSLRQLLRLNGALVDEKD